MKKQVNMQEIASELGLSRMTVSAVVNNCAKKRGISDKTVIRVKEYLQERGYVPSKYARQLRGVESNSTGILMCGHLYSHLNVAFNLMISEMVMDINPLEIIMARTEEIEKGLQELVSKGVEKLLWIHTISHKRDLLSPKKVIPYLKRFEQVVIYNYAFSENVIEKELLELGVNLVGVDRYEGFCRLGALLKQYGHENIAYSGLPVGITENNGNQAAQAFDHLKINYFGCCPKGFNALEMKNFSGEIARIIIDLQKRHGVTAFCCFGDEMAGLVMTELIRRGIEIPKNLSVTGFDGMDFAEAYTVPLTTLSLPVKEMQETAVGLLKGDEHGQRSCFPLDIIQRESLDKANF